MRILARKRNSPRLLAPQTMRIFAESMQSVLKNAQTCESVLKPIANRPIRLPALFYLDLSDNSAHTQLKNRVTTILNED